jgi:hypothetical protein
MYLLLTIIVLCDILVLLLPFYVAKKRGIIAGVVTALTWIPLIICHSKLFYLILACGHGSGGGVCDYLGLIIFGPHLFAFFIVWFFFMITKQKRKPTKVSY